MKALAIRRDGCHVRDALVDRVLCYDVRDACGQGGRGDKGACARREHGGRVCSAAAWDELHVIEVEPGDLHEEEVGKPGCPRSWSAMAWRWRGYTGGQWTLAAARAAACCGIRAEALAAVNIQPRHLGVHAVRSSAGRRRRDGGQGQGDAARDRERQRWPPSRSAARAARGVMESAGRSGPRPSAPWRRERLEARAAPSASRPRSS